MTLTEIVSAIKEGKKVYFRSLEYQVIYDYKRGYFIKCENTNHKIGLTWEDGRTLNGRKEDFFVLEK